MEGSGSESPPSPICHNVLANAVKQTNGKICIFEKMEELKRHIDQIKALCDTNKVISLFAFGSVTTDGFRTESDIDLIVDIEENDPFTYSDNYFNLKFALELLLKREIDLLEQKAIKNPYLKQQIEKTKVLVYGKSNQDLAV